MSERVLEALLAEYASCDAFMNRVSALGSENDELRYLLAETAKAARGGRRYDEELHDQVRRALREE